MAKGFIILEDRSCFSTRWTGFDELIRLAAKELLVIHNGKELSDWLLTIVPKEYIHNDPNAWGTGFINEAGEMIIGKSLDIRSLTTENQKFFWTAMKNAMKKLMISKEEYSTLNPEVLKELLKRHKQSNSEDDPLNHSDWNVLADEEFETEGPGWAKS